MQSHLALLLGSLALLEVVLPAEVCDYKCQDRGACTVKYVGPSRAGKTTGEKEKSSFKHRKKLP